MQRISPGGFAVALVILTVVWMILPDAARVPLAIVLILGALAWTGHPAGVVNRFFSLLK